MREQTYLVLLALTDVPLHGYGLISFVRQISDGRVRLGAGTLYGALDRLAGEGLVSVVKEEVVDGRNRRYYDLTGAGQQVLAEETSRLAKLAATGRQRLSAAQLRPQAGA
jgi:DNA-binding PadR family transcriptional regulator